MADKVGDQVMSLFTEAVYKKYVVPKLLRIFTVHEYHVHLLLLRYFKSFIHLIDQEDLEMEILPQVKNGFKLTKFWDFLFCLFVFCLFFSGKRTIFCMSV